MRTLRMPTSFLILPLCVVAGCAATSGVSPKMRTVGSVGDRPLPVVTGEPGASVVADRTVPDRPLRRQGRISGRVFDEDGEPIADARVRLAVGNAPGGRVISATTDRTGAFTLSGVRPGTSYTVIAEWEDDQGPLTGRSVVQAPDTNVRITLAATEGDPRGAAASARPKRVSPISERDSRSSQESDADFDPEPAGQPRVNVEDLPPATEAEAFAPAKEARRAPSSSRESPARVAPSAPAQRRAAPAGADRAPEDSEVQDSAAPFAGPEADAPEDEGSNPLPPALEPGQAAATPAPRSRIVADATQGGTDPAEGSAALAGGSQAAREAEADVFESALATTAADRDPEPARETAATAAVLPAQDPFDDPPPPARAKATAPGAIVAAPAISDQSVFETDAEGDDTPPSAAPSASDGRRRPTWGDLASTGPVAPGPVRTDDVPEGYPADVPAPAAPRRSGPVAARAAPTPPTDTGRSFCDYDPKLRRIKEFRLPDLEGRPVRFQDLDADLVLLDFWGTWCQPCIRSIPHLVDLQKRLGPQKLKVVGVACEQGPVAERGAKVAKEVRRLGINYPVVLSGLDGPCPLQEALKVQAFPTLVLVDRQGRIVWRDEGSTPVTLARLDRFLAMSTKPDGARRY